LRSVLDRVKPAEHGLIVRTAAEHATEQELRADMARLLEEWERIDAAAKKSHWSYFAVSRAKCCGACYS